MAEPRPGELTAAQFAFRLRAAMEAAGHTSVTAAAALEWSAPRISEYLSGTRTPGATKLLWLVERLGLDWSIIAPETIPKKIPRKRK